MKKWFWLVFLPVALLLVFLIYGWVVPRKVDYFLLEPRDFFATLVAAGRIEFAQEVELSFSVAGKLQALYVNEGDTVEQGQLLLALESLVEENQLQLAQNALELAEVRLRKIAEQQRALAWEEYRRARMDQEAAFDEYLRAQRLFLAGSIPKEELESLRRKWQQALSLENSLRISLESIQEDGIDFLEARKQLERARLEHTQAEIKLQERRLMAPFDGVIVVANKTPGEFVQAGEPVLTLGRKPLQVVTRLDEREYKKLMLGMKALVSEQAGPREEMLTAWLDQVAPVVDPEQGTVEATFLLDRVPDSTKSGAAVDVEIIVQEEKGVLLVPERYLVARDGRQAVWIAQEGRASLIYIQNPTYLDGWVKVEGLMPGTAILEPAGLQEGRKIALRERRDN